MSLTRSELLTQARLLIDGFSGHAGFAFLNLHTGDASGINARQSFPTASMIKLPILVELFQQVEDGRWRLEQPREVRVVEHVGGSGILKHLTPGIFLPLRDLAYLMMSVSDNTATNILIDLVDLENVTQRMRALGCSNLVLRHKIDFDHAWTEPEHLGVGTPEDFVALMTKLWRKEILSEESRAEMFRMMAGVGADRAGRWLPINPYGPEMAARGYDVGETVSFAGKTGGLVGVRGQVAVIWNDSLAYAQSIMTTGARDLSWGVDSEGSLFAAKLGKLLFDYVTHHSTPRKEHRKAGGPR